MLGQLLNVHIKAEFAEQQSTSPFSVTSQLWAHLRETTSPRSPNESKRQREPLLWGLTSAMWQKQTLWVSNWCAIVQRSSKTLFHLPFKVWNNITSSITLCVVLRIFFLLFSQSSGCGGIYKELHDHFFQFNYNQSQPCFGPLGSLFCWGPPRPDKELMDDPPTHLR